jgi:hypothetical protein
MVFYESAKFDADAILPLRAIGSASDFARSRHNAEQHHSSLLLKLTSVRSQIHYVIKNAFCPHGGREAICHENVI